MSKKLRLFTISSGSVTEGVTVEKLTLKGAQKDIPAVMVGESGRGRERGVLPVYLPANLLKEWEQKGTVTIKYAELGTTQAGKPKLIAVDKPDTDAEMIAVFRTKIGFRGGNSHTGDRSGWKCRKYGCETTGEGINKPDACPKCGATGDYDGPQLQFAPLPGETIVKGSIAQGDAGRMGGGEQLVVKIPKGAIFRTAYSGRLYGAPGSHYYKFDGSKVMAATWDERASTDLF